MSTKQVRRYNFFLRLTAELSALYCVTRQSFFELIPPLSILPEVPFWFALCSLRPLENIKPLTCWFARTRVWNILRRSNTVGVKCSPLLPILTGQGASAQTCLLLHSVTVTLQVNKTDGSAQVFLEGTNAMVKDKLLRMGEKLTFQTQMNIYWCTARVTLALLGVIKIASPGREGKAALKPITFSLN